MNAPADDPASITAIWQVNRQDIQDTAQANGPLARPAVEQPTEATPARATATDATPGQLTRNTSTPDPSREPHGPAQARGPPTAQQDAQALRRSLMMQRMLAHYSWSLDS